MTSLWSVSVTLIDASPQFRRWTEAEMVGYTTDGQRALAKYLPRVSTRIDAIRLQAGTRRASAKILAADVKPGDGMAPFRHGGEAADRFGEEHGRRWADAGRRDFTD